MIVLFAANLTSHQFNISRKYFVTIFNVSKNKNSATRKLPVFSDYSPVVPATTHAGNNYPQLTGMQVEKRHLYQAPISGG